jgi:hypothetical protein
VKSYRIYIVGKDGRLRLGEAFEATADADAIARAEMAADTGEAAELWEGGRMIGTASDGVFVPRGGPAGA